MTPLLELSDKSYLRHCLLSNTNLVKLDVTLRAGIQFNIFFDFLEQSPNLKSLLVSGPCHPIVFSPSNRRITFPHLKRFTIVKIILPIVDVLLTYISFPPSIKVHIATEPQWNNLMQYNFNPDEALFSSPALVSPPYLDPRAICLPSGERRPSEIGDVARTQTIDAESTL